MTLPAIPELTSPPPLAAVALLAVNEHLLKQAWPGGVTGLGGRITARLRSLSLALSVDLPPRASSADPALGTIVLFGGGVTVLVTVTVGVEVSTDGPSSPPRRTGR